MTVVRLPGASIPVNPGASVLEIEFLPTDGQTLMIQDTDALLINVLLWPDAPLLDLQLILPAGMVVGRRVFIYTDQPIAQLTVTSGDDAMVANGVASLNMNDLIVFNTVSTNNKLWARVATS